MEKSLSKIKTQDISVDFIDIMGNDDSVVNAARVSFSKLASNYTPEQNERLIKYLASHAHWTPFAHTAITLKVAAPIFVSRQLVKHTVGGVINEVSRRYVSDEPTLYVPNKDAWRGKPVNSKQGSSEEFVEIDEELLNAALETSLNCYEDMINKGVAPEMARMVLPHNLVTEWYWTGSLVFWQRVCKQRLDPHAQLETRLVAEQINKIVSEKFPISWHYLMA